MTHRIAVIGGDGIGPEVTAEALKVVRAAGVEIDTTDFDLGGARYLRDGEILSDEVLDQLASVRLHPARRGRYARGAARASSSAACC
jgi:isocitrate/isopropylmalate dehydrogenase